jgi:hypothetical protein
MQAARDSDELDELALSVLGQEAVLVTLKSVRCTFSLPLTYALQTKAEAKSTWASYHMKAACLPCRAMPEQRQNTAYLC